MKFRKNRKGFTIVELIIVIAVIGVLTAVLVPTIVHLVNKANKASDQSLVSNLNKSLAMRNSEAGENCKTMHEAVESLEPYGYKLDALVTKGDQDLLFNLKQNKFYLADSVEGEAKDLWKIQDKIEENQVYNVYAGANFADKEIANLKVGFDAGRKSMTSIGYNNDDATDVLIRAYGEDCVVTITAPNKDVNYYGYSARVVAQEVKGSSLHIFGGTNQLNVVKGHVQVEPTGIVFELGGSAEGSVTNNGFIGETALGASVTVSGNEVGGALKINSLAQLESFRDVVNAGNDFYGKKVELLEDVKLHNGWKPIGEGSRKVVNAAEAAEAQGRFFRGEFNGNGKTISNLNNDGFVPNESRVTGKQYAFGLFAITGDGAKISNVNLSDVKVDTTNTGLDLVGDSIGALVGFGYGSLTVENVKVLSGSLKGSDGIAGIIGRVYANDTGKALTVKGCENNASVTATDKGGKAAGIVAMAGDVSNTDYTLDVTLTSCVNKGAISSTNTTEAYAAGILGFATNNRSNAWHITSCSNSGAVSGKAHDNYCAKYTEGKLIIA